MTRAHLRNVGSFNPALWSLHFEVTGGEIFTAGLGIPSSILHETYHATQAIGTTLGCWLGVLDLLKGYSFKAYLEESRVTGVKPPRHLPFLEVLTADERVEGAIFDGPSVANIWNSIRMVRNVLLGDNPGLDMPPSDFYRAWENVFTVLTLFSSMGFDGNAKGSKEIRRNASGIQHTSRCLKEILRQHQNKLAPKGFDADIYRPYYIGGRMLMENAAVLVTSVPPENTTIGNFSQSIFDQYSPLYSFLLKPLMAKFQNIQHLPYKAFQQTALAIIDLALMTPLLPGYTEQLRPDMKWEDLHPGFRFMRILRIILEDSIPPIIDARSDYEPFVQRLCKSIGWSTPVEISSQVLNSSSTGLVVLGLKRHLTRLQMACSIRSRQPWALAIPGTGEFTEHETEEVVFPITALFFSDDYLVLDEETFVERLPVLGWNWIADKFMTSESLRLDQCDIFGCTPALMSEARSLVVSYLEQLPRSDGSGLGPYLNLKDYS
jgi:hypothetical protein